jgi:hypothetical protein
MLIWFFLKFYEKVSQEKHKTIYSGLMGSGIATGVFQSPESQFKNQPPHFSQPNNSRKLLAEIGLISEDDFSRMAKSRKLTYCEWPNPGDDLLKLPKPSL